MSTSEGKLNSNNKRPSLKGQPSARTPSVGAAAASAAAATTAGSKSSLPIAMKLTAAVSLCALCGLGLYRQYQEGNEALVQQEMSRLTALETNPQQSTSQKR